jgi:hypothetical protein
LPYLAELDDAQNSVWQGAAATFEEHVAKL